MSDELLFVYGTLRPAALAQAPAHIASAVKAKAQAIGAGSVSGALHWIAWCPGLVESKDGRVSGDVYALDTTLLATLDAYEGDEYERRRIRVTLSDGGELETWAYVYLNANKLGRRIESGDFVSEMASA